MRVVQYAVAFAVGASLAGGAMAQTAPAAPEKETWAGPFGGSFTATFAFSTDYSYRGISQTQREVAIQPSATYEVPLFGSPISAYVGAWASNVKFLGSNANPEVDLITGFRAKAFDDKLTADLGYIRYMYWGGDRASFFDFDEYGLVLGYDFGVASVTGAVRYSPNFYANSGIAWYKWGQISVPLTFVKLHDEVALKVFATLGHQYVERNLNYGIGANGYLDWQVGVGVSLFGVDLAVAYTDTDLDSPNCGNTLNCEARVIFTISKTF
ncbi:MAG: hypothetical protein FJX02_03155 [Alphaproteobacteria bacterium]|nr:hypothetical protein [Alphaproteobacteria bacterium]